jgi:hypothetical protein
VTAKEKARVIEERLHRLATLNAGRLTPDAVVADANTASGPYHDHFEWDDSIAGHKYRLDQARELIRSVKLEVSVVSRTIAAPSYVRDPRASGEEQGYVSTLHVRTEADLAREVVHDEMKRIVAAIERARSIADVLGLSTEVEVLLRLAVDLRERTSTASTASAAAS